MTIPHIYDFGKHLRQSLLANGDLDLLKNWLQEEYEHTYQEWKEKEFDINHLFSLKGKENSYKRNFERSFEATLLHVATQNFYCGKKSIQNLLGKGANVNAQNSLGKTPLHFSTMGKITQVLLDADADPFIRDRNGWAAIEWACDGKRLLKEKYKHKAIKVGSVCGVIAALAVGGVLFATGVALPILALVGIAVAAAVLTGLIAGGITYVISSKIENPDTSRLATEQGLPQPN